MTRVVVVGCGVVGAAIAYELSQVPGLEIMVLDRQPPAQASTGAALGVLMGAVSQKLKGNNLQMRLSSIRQYDRWIPELESVTGQAILFNRQGILRLCMAGEDLESWRSLAAVRQQQGWQLQVWDRAQLATDYPQLNLEQVMGAVYSPGDRQLDPTALTLALVQASEQRGVTFCFDADVVAIASQSTSESDERIGHTVQTSTAEFGADWCVIAAGVGSTPLTKHLQQPVDIRPVLGQAMQVQLAQPLGNPNHQPVITGDDTHIVPLGDGGYWLGATVEFGVDGAAPVGDPGLLEAVRMRAIALCPALANAAIVRTWSGLRPRPEGRPAPIIERLAGYRNVLLATGHYRNGILLAPATASRVRQMIA